MGLTAFVAMEKVLPPSNSIMVQNLMLVENRWRSNKTKYLISNLFYRKYILRKIDILRKLVLINQYPQSTNVWY